MKINNWNLQLWLFIFLISLLRAYTSTQFDLGVDEAHYALYGKYLDWSYFDHPPLVGWTQFLFSFLPINENLKYRLAAILLSAFGSYLTFLYLKNKSSSESVSYFAVVALNLTPLYNALSIALLPDSFFIPLTIGVLIVTEKIISSEYGTLKQWLLLGFCLGLCALSKYTAFLFVIALTLSFILNRKMKALLKWQLWAGATLSLLMALPILYWNSKNNFVSFAYQGKHVFHFDSSLLKTLLTSASIQFFSWGLGPFLISIYVFFKSLKRISFKDPFLNLHIFSGVFFLFFVYIAFSEVLLPHWMLMFFVLTIPFSTMSLLKNQNKRSIKVLLASTIISAAMSLSMLFEVSFKLFPARYTSGIYEGITGWEELLTKAREHLTKVENSQKSIGVMNWTLGSRALFYNRELSDVQVLDSRYDQFDIWNPQTPKLGFDYILLIENSKKEQNLKHLNCAKLTFLDEKQTKINDVSVNHFLYYHCQNLISLVP